MQLIELADRLKPVHEDPSSKIAEASFFEMIQCGCKAFPQSQGVSETHVVSRSVWANATDLSLLTSLSHEDIIKLQSGGTESKMGNILKNDSIRVWQHVKSLDGGRLDIVFDNSGFEVFADLVLADWIVSKTPFIKTVVFHPKTIRQSIYSGATICMGTTAHGRNVQLGSCLMSSMG